MKILYITTPGEEYLEDQILIGLRRKFGANCVDYPRKDQVYERSFTIKKRLYGHGFTVWNSLPEIKIDRTNIPSRINVLSI